MELTIVEFCIVLLLIFAAFGGGVFVMYHITKPGAPEFEDTPRTSLDTCMLSELDVDDHFVHQGHVYTLYEKNNGWGYALNCGDEPHSKTLPLNTPVRLHLK